MTNVTVTKIDNSILNQNEIQELWLLNLLEFKDETFNRYHYRRFFRRWCNFMCNDHVLEMISWSNLKVKLNRTGFCVTLKSLPELYKHDVQYYGNVENAIQMWQWRYVDKSKWVTEDGWTDCNKELSFNPNKEYQRKESTGLPFDLERANSKEVVERLLPNGTWCILNNPNSVDRDITFQVFSDDYYQILNDYNLLIYCTVEVHSENTIVSDNRFIVSKSDLRMRFPKREIK